MLKLLDGVVMRLLAVLSLAIAYIAASAADQPIIAKVMIGTAVVVVAFVALILLRMAFNAWLAANKDLPELKRKLEAAEKDLQEAQEEVAELEAKVKQTCNAEVLAEDLIENRNLLRDYLSDPTSWEDAVASCLDTIKLSSKTVLEPTDLVDYFAFWLPTSSGGRLNANPVSWVAESVTDLKGIETAAKKVAERHKGDRDPWQIQEALRNNSFPGRWIAVNTLHADGTLLGVLTVVTRSAEALECCKGIIEVYAHEAREFLSHGCSVKAEGGAVHE